LHLLVKPSPILERDHGNHCLSGGGCALGSVFGPVGAMIGQAAGAMLGSVVDKSLINGSQTKAGTHLATARIPGADEGTAVTRIYGTARLGGTLIWATRFEEAVSKERSGGKASGRASRPSAISRISPSALAKDRSPASVVCGSTARSLT